MIKQLAPQEIQQTIQELERCGFQPCGRLVTQGSGLTGRALSADGSTWAEVVLPQSGLRNSLRRLLKTGALRGAGCTAQFTTEFNNRSYLVTTTAEVAAAAGLLLERLPPETPLELLALRHMQRLEQHLCLGHPLKALIHTSAGEVEAARQRMLAGRPAAAFSVDSLLELGVSPRLALLIAGDCAEAAETLPL